MTTYAKQFDDLIIHKSLPSVSRSRCFFYSYAQHAIWKLLALLPRLRYLLQTRRVLQSYSMGGGHNVARVPRIFSLLNQFRKIRLANYCTIACLRLFQGKRSTGQRPIVIVCVCLVVEICETVSYLFLRLQFSESFHEPRIRDFHVIAIT